MLEYVKEIYKFIIRVSTNTLALVLSKSPSLSGTNGLDSNRTNLTFQKYKL